MSTLSIFRNRKRIIPFYLYKIKIKTIRTKIILRKYAYLFYNKTISKVLLSTAQKHYERRMVKTCFRKLKNHWYEERVQWRLLLRANLHYNNFLKLKSFDCWKCFVLRKNQKNVMMRIANLYYVHKLKSNCFKRMVDTPNINKNERLVSKSIQTYTIFLFLYLNSLEVFRACFSLHLKHFCKMIDERSFKRRRLKSYFKHWKLYTETEKVKNNNENLIRLFRKLKFNPKLTKRAFNNWICFTNRSIDKKGKLNKIEDFFNDKLKRQYLLHLYEYALNRTYKRCKKYNADVFFQRRLLRKCIQNLVVYRKSRSRKYERIKTTIDFYKSKLQKSCLQKLKKHGLFKVRKREALEFAELYSVKKLTQSYFSKVKVYKEYKNLKRRRYKDASTYYVKRTLRKHFKCLQSYYGVRKQKENARLSLIKQALNTRNVRVAKNIFAQWSLYTSACRKEKKKLLDAESYYQSVLLFKYLAKWRAFFTNAKLLMLRLKHADVYYNTVLMQHIIDKWKMYLNELNWCRSYISKAKVVYKHQLIQNGMRLILTSAFALTEARQKMAFAKYYNAHLLALKYFHKWKYKTFEVDVNKKHFGGDTKIVYDTLSFQWNPICFEPPKIPTFIRSIVND